MILSEGQHLALKQLKRIADYPQSALRIDNVVEKDNELDYLRVDISIDCSHYEKSDGGLKYHDRESFSLWIEFDFPFSVPSVTTTHTRFRNFHHVQWGNTLCLYISKESQWDPSLGIVGLINQFNKWLTKAALNQLDEVEGPIHPPVAYPVSNTTAYFQKDTPSSDKWPWIGTATFDVLKQDLISFNDWKLIEELGAKATFTPAILLNFELSFEYPRYIKTLFKWFDIKGIDSIRLLTYMMLAAERLDENQPMRIIIGTPSRGTVGDISSRRQHLKVWEISPEDTKKIKRVSIACDLLSKFKDTDTEEAIRELINPVFEELFKWQEECKIGWCNVVENRPEIIVPRDKGSNMSWFKDRNVHIWGCGAIGSQVAEHLVRAGISKLTIIDYDHVDPGVLVRQNFTQKDLNDKKVEALKRRLIDINPDLIINEEPSNLLHGYLNIEYWDQEFDLVIDSTASLIVRMKLEKVLKQSNRKAPIVNMMLSGAARHGMMVLSPPGYSGGPFDVIRRLGLAAKNRDWLDSWVDSFWKKDTSEPTRQPEPGCSDPTFIGSNADVASLSSRMLNTLAKHLSQNGSDAVGMLLSQDNEKRKDEVFYFAPDIIVSENNIEYRISLNAWRDVKAWIASATRERSPEDETGGLMFGQYDESLNIGWVTSVSGPPKDSLFSPKGFVCGIEGTSELCEEQKLRSLGAVQYVGTWHSHPVSQATPSSTDFEGIGTLFAANPEQGPFQLMMIVGNASTSNTEIGIYSFEKLKFEKHNERLNLLSFNIKGKIIQAPGLPKYRHRIGLALSGGGSRAVAFHLGTLRALEDTGLLNDIDLISGVSGGSIVTGLFGYSNETFKNIEGNIHGFLKRGLVIPSFKKLCNPLRFIRVFYFWLVTILPSVILSFIVNIIKKFISFIGFGNLFHRFINQVNWPLRRKYSRTHVMADAIAERVGAGRCNKYTRNGMKVVFNACELSTGTAFRMSNSRYGGWRFGWAPAADLRIADAIAASAAFPVLLPAFDWIKVFTKKGIKNSKRVLITDGGVYENIGVSVMEPGTSAEYNVFKYEPEILIASDASAGQFSGELMPTYWTGRMIQVMSSVMRKVQDATKSRLHAYAKDGYINAFVYAHLGQIDERVPMKPSTWISRDEVMNYPTDFSAMSDKNISKLSNRGEIIARTLVTRYLLSD